MFTAPGVGEHDSGQSQLKCERANGVLNLRKGATQTDIVQELAETVRSTLPTCSPFSMRR